MNARDEARALAEKTFVKKTCAGEEVDPVFVSADAASDVWEPLIRELVDAFGSATISFEFANDEQRDQSTRMYAAWIAARRALGIEDT